MPLKRNDTSHADSHAVKIPPTPCFHAGTFWTHVSDGLRGITLDASAEAAGRGGLGRKNG